MMARHGDVVLRLHSLPEKEFSTARPFDAGDRPLYTRFFYRHNKIMLLIPQQMNGS